MYYLCSINQPLTVVTPPSGGDSPRLLLFDLLTQQRLHTFLYVLLFLLV